MRYENWKDLKPLKDPVALGAKCVCLVDWEGFNKGDVVTIDEDYDITPLCIDENGEKNVMAYHELALLPEDATMPEQKPARKIVQIAIGATEREDSFAALCDDGTAWHLVVNKPDPTWFQLPPIPQP